MAKLPAFTTICVALGMAFQAVGGSRQIGCKVHPADVHDGYFITRVALQSYGVPAVSLEGATYISDKVAASNLKSGKPEVKIGMERKAPFAIISIPVGAGCADGACQRLDSFTLVVTEADKLPATGVAAKTTSVPHSLLSSGTWYKIAIPKTGFYKLDYSFISSLGINPADINPANIRIAGNGGRMLSEDNAVSRADDLTENAVWVNDGGDNQFNDGDFVVFYGVGTTAWYQDTTHKTLFHKNNLYADSACYFVSFNSGAGRRIQVQAPAGTANVAATGFDYYDVHDVDAINPSTYGKTWFGEKFWTDAGTNNQSFNFDLGDVVGQVNCKIDFGCTQASYYSLVKVSINGALQATEMYNNITGGDIVMRHTYPTITNYTINSRNLTVGINFVPSEANAAGYLNYIEVSCRRSLTMTTDQLSFRDWNTVGAGKIASYSLQAANTNTQVWDVTNPLVPVIMPGSLTSSGYNFVQDASRLHEFAAFNNYNFPVPVKVGVTENQDLHALPATDMIIVTHPSFIDAAHKIEEYHHSHDGLRVTLVTTNQIYNEFSSGIQDISAIRDFARMLYKKAGSDTADMPRYLLLMGNGSYDYKSRIAGNCNFVPTFEADNDSNDLFGFLSDDFFGFLDDNENSENASLINALDMGVGRIPARTVADANIVADKIVNYRSAATLGPWRISTMFVADDNDGAGNHMDDAEVMAACVTANSKNLYNEQKVYVNAMPVISTPAGPRCPNASAAINDQVFKGAAMINYNGHGNPQVWAGERILTQDDFNGWSNANMLPFVITATCDFGQYDHPQYVSAAEQLLVKQGGGVIALVTTTGAVYAGYNQPMNKEFLTAQFTKNTNDTWNTFGDACRKSKNNTYLISNDPDRLANFRKFVLLGDPALMPDFPQYNLQMDSIVDGATNVVTDSVKALGKYIINGSVRNNNGELLTWFNGTLYVSFFDKARSITITSYDRTTRTFKLQDNLIYKGKVTVVNGRYNFSFIVPKDINYYYSKGKLSTYAENGTTDAAGADSNIVVGGFSDHPVISTTAPVVQAYINDSLFVNGGITGTNTSLFAKIVSETGINVSGYGIGHNLTAVLDGQSDNPYILNDYYETAPNTYQLGYVKFPVSGIADGYHTFTIKAWDANNNAGEGTVAFTVVDGKIVDIQSLGNYPNPFSSTTHFIFEHNHPDEQMDVKISIYNAGGTIVRTISESILATGSRTAAIVWDGTDNSGTTLPSGLYLYRLNIKTEKGFSSTAHQKLVIVR